jgi:magnesium transporter
MDLNTQFELSNEFLDRFQEALEAKDSKFITESLGGVSHADITELLYQFDSDECKYVLEILDPAIGSDVVSELDEDTRRKFIKKLEPQELAKYIELMDSDDGADILFDINIKDREEIIGFIKDEENANNLLDLLRYDDDVAGGLMAKELIKCNLNWTILQCIDEIRKQAETVEKIYSVYVVDDFGKLVGKVSLKKIILSEDSAKVRDIYDEDIVSVETYLEEEEVAQIMRKYDLESVPVVNARGKLVGRITIDDIVDVITEQAEQERAMMSGISADVEEDDTIWRLSKARLPWLTIGMIGGLMGAWMIGLFEKDIILIPAMAFFIPLITATGGNVGIQSSSLVVQSLANPSAFSESMVRRFLKVLLVAILNGLVLAILVLIAIWLITKDQSMASTVGFSLFAVVLLASLMGTITPLVLDKFGVNPALASGPFITTANDILGLAVYFTTAHFIYGL